MSEIRKIFEIYLDEESQATARFCDSSLENLDKIDQKEIRSILYSMYTFLDEKLS